MNKSTIFKSAHNKARLHGINCAITGRKFNYQVSFSYYLKEATNSQPQKVTVYTNVKSINKACAMVGDYTKPVQYKKPSSLVVTYNLGTLLMLIMIVLLNPFTLLACYGLYANFF